MRLYCRKVWSIAQRVSDFRSKRSHIYCPKGIYRHNFPASLFFLFSSLLRCSLSTSCLSASCSPFIIPSPLFTSHHLEPPLLFVHCLSSSLCCFYLFYFFNHPLFISPAVPLLTGLISHSFSHLFLCLASCSTHTQTSHMLQTALCKAVMRDKAKTMRQNYRLYINMDSLGLGKLFHFWD